jgi:hypothetical protein
MEGALSSLASTKRAKTMHDKKYAVAKLKISELYFTWVPR